MNVPEKDPFSLADDADGAVPPVPPPKPTPPPPTAPDVDEEGGNGFLVVPLEEIVREPTAGPRPGTAPRPPAPEHPRREPGEEGVVDTRTVAERRGEAVAIVAGRRPPPDGWPGEAFGFPLLKPGPRTIAGAAVLLTLLDLASRANFFLGLMLKLIAAVFFLRWQVHVASRSAAGRDEPAGWAGAMELTREKIRGIGFFLIAAVVLIAPGIIADVFGRSGLALVLFLGGGMLLAVGALGQVVGDPTLIRPWNALAWIARHPLGLLAATAGWWAAGWTEILVWWMRDASTGLYVPACFALRLVGMYLWLLSARALGVVGRSWSLFDDDGPVDAPQDDPAATSREGR